MADAGAAFGVRNQLMDYCVSNAIIIEERRATKLWLPTHLARCCVRGAGFDRAIQRSVGVFLADRARDDELVVHLHAGFEEVLG